MTPGLQCAAGNPGACMWFTNYTFIPGYPTLPDDMRTFQDMYIEGMGNYDWTTKNPWRAPGLPLCIVLVEWQGGTLMDVQWEGLKETVQEVAMGTDLQLSLLSSQMLSPQNGNLEERERLGGG